MAWFQEIKRDLIYRKSERCRGRAIHPDRTRLLGYLISTLDMDLLYNYQGQIQRAQKVQRQPDPIDTENAMSTVVLSPPSPLPMVISGTIPTLEPTHAAKISTFRCDYPEQSGLYESIQ